MAVNGALERGGRLGDDWKILMLSCASINKFYFLKIAEKESFYSSSQDPV